MWEYSGAETPKNHKQQTKKSEMDNEEKNYEGKNEPSAQANSGSDSDGVHYKKVNLYNDDPHAFDRRGGFSSTPRGNGGYYRSKESYRRGEGGYRPDRNNGAPYRPRVSRQDDGRRPDSGYSGYSGRYRDERYGREYPDNPRYSRYSPRENSTGGYRGANAEGGYAERRPSGRYEYRRGRNDAEYGYNHGQPAKPQAPYGGGRRYAPSAKYSPRKRIQYAEENFDPDAPIRLNKYLANAGVCSRRDADKYISAGVVTVNGETITELGTKIKRTDEVRFNNEPVSMEKKVYVVLNKPKDYVTTSDDPQNRKTVMDLVKNACRERIYPVGRLDRNTTGVLLLTNDGELASKLTHPKYKKKKIYHVYLDQKISAADMQQLADGITLDDGEVHADAIEYASATDKKQVGIEIHSGRNRVVRRMFETLGYHVTKLDRVYFAGLTKKNLRRGQWRYLTQDEVNYLKMGEFE